MNKQFVLLLSILFSLGLKAQDTTNVLFIGNSITYFNSMPQTFESIANSKGNPTKVTLYAPGGTGFVNHVNDARVFNHFKKGDWDYVILQPGSNESPGYSYPISQTLSRARSLIDSIKAYNQCVDILFYEISYGVWGSSSSNLVTYNNTMTAIKSNLTLLADSTFSFFAPVGEAFRTAWNANQSEMLWGGVGDIHPNAKGSYIAACVFYATIFQKPSLGSSVTSTLTRTDSRRFQTLADSIVLNNLSDWKINTYNQYTNFSYSLNSKNINLTNLSKNYDSVLWVFGDGNSSSSIHLTHSYSSAGNYTVKLITYSKGCVDTNSQNITIAVTDLNENLNQKKWIIYPNPASNYLNIQGPDDGLATYSIYTVNGSLILRTQNRKIDISKYTKGIYVLKIETGNHNFTHRIKWVKY